jgi:hypothetical protein
MKLVVIQWHRDLLANAFLAIAQVVREELLRLSLGDFEPRIDIRPGMAIADGPFRRDRDRLSGAAIRSS